MLFIAIALLIAMLALILSRIWTRPSQRGGAGEDIIIIDVDPGKSGNIILEQPKQPAKSGSKAVSAVAKAILDGDSVSHVNIISSGSGYVYPPCVIFSGGGGSGAKALARISKGQVVDIKVILGGKDYQLPPKVSFNPLGCLPDAQERNVIAAPAQQLPAIDDGIKPADEVAAEELKVETEQAKAKLKTIEKIKAKDAKMAVEAVALGLPPPPPLFSEEQEQEVRALAQRAPRQLNPDEQAACDKKLAESNQANLESVDLGKQSMVLPTLRDKAVEAGKRAAALQEEYKKMCL
jgi:hypothetical protein